MQPTVCSPFYVQEKILMFAFIFCFLFTTEADEDLDNQQVEDVVPTSIEDLGIMVHVKARSSPYPNSAQERFNVPADKVKWDVSMNE